MVTLQDQLENVLTELELAGNIVLSAIISRQGLLMVSKATQGSNCKAFAALTATLNMSAESITKRLSHEMPKSIVVETEEHNLITYAAGPNALIVVMASNEGFLGLILTELKKAADKVKELV